MKINQESAAFKPITIVLEEQHEAEAFFELIDKLDSFKNNDGVTFHRRDITTCQYELIRKLSDARTVGEVVYAAKAECFFDFISKR